MNELISTFRSYLLEHGRSERTAEAYTSDVARYIAWCEKEYRLAFTTSMLNRSDLHDYQAQCRKVQRVQAATWNRYMASLEIFATWLNLDINDALTRAESQKLAPHSLEDFEYRRFRLAVIEAVRNPKTHMALNQALRNAAVITLLADAGLREGEVVHLRVQDLILRTNKGSVVICDAKGNKDRMVPLDKDSVDTLKAWLAIRPAGGDELFIGKRGEPLQERGIQKLVATIARDAHIEHVTPHQLRHTAAYRLIKAGGNLNEVAEILGHSSLETTRRYTLPHYGDLENLMEMA
jgi:integrase/recombinase XerC